MSGKPDPHRVQSQPLGYLDVDQRQRDRDAEPSFEDGIEKAVARVFVVVAISLEALADEEGVIQTSDALDVRGGWRYLVLDALAECVEYRQLAGHIDLGVERSGDPERPFSERDLAVGSPNQLRERLARIHVRQCRR